MKYYKFMLVQGSKEGRHENVFYIGFLITQDAKYLFALAFIFEKRMLMRNITRNMYSKPFDRAI